VNGFGTGTSSHTGLTLPLCFLQAIIVVGMSVVIFNAVCRYAHKIHDCLKDSRWQQSHIEQKLEMIHISVRSCGASQIEPFASTGNADITEVFRLFFYGNKDAHFGRPIKAVQSLYLD
jgi:hypothetical protein